MYIKRLYLKNIRCFREITIDFEGHASSILILGENGDGKSTILKSLAMGLCDESSSAALFRELPGETVRREKEQEEVPTGEKGFIVIDLVSHNGNKYQIKTKITSLKKFERVSQELFETKNGERKRKIEQDEFPWDQIFVSGYGPGIRVHATSSFQHYLAVDAVYPLFNYTSELQNPELVLRRLISAARDKKEDYEEKEREEIKLFSMIQDLMKDFLDLESPNDFKLTATGIKVGGHWGTAELSELGDGFQALIILISDLLSWWFLRENGNSVLNLKAIKGIVIIDEIEQHLHPKWQRRIFSLLKEKFPNIQFIVASHSPLVASANKKVNVHLLSPGKHEIFNPYGWLAEGVYEKMGLESRPITFVDEEISRYRFLDNKNNKKKLMGKEKKEFYALKKELSKLPESDPIKLLIEIENATSDFKKTIKEKGK